MSVFIRGTSYWFKLDPRARLLFMIGIFLVAFAFDDPIILAVIMGLEFIFIMNNELSMGKLYGIIRPLSMTLLFYALITIFWVNPTPMRYRLTPFMYVWGNMFPIDVGTLLYLVGIILRVYIMTVSAWFVTMTLTPPELVAALSKWRLPPSFAVAGAASFASLPFLQTQIETIKEAIQSKGWETENKGLIGTLRSYVPILFPVFFMTLKRSQDLALAMECRGVSQIQNRKPRKQLKFIGRDWLFSLVMMGGGFSAILLFYVYGFGSVNFTISILRAAKILV